MILGILGLELGVFLAMFMFVIFMAMILTGYNVAFPFAGTAIVFAFIGDLTDTFDPPRGRFRRPDTDVNNADPDPPPTSGAGADEICPLERVGQRVTT